MKEYRNIKQSRIINQLIPEAINQNNEINKEMKKRLRLNRIFNEFENKASNGLNYFINLSSQRYNSLRNGHSLKNLIISSRQKDQYEAHKILQDPFFTDLNLEKEKEKMKIIKTKDLNRNIAPILSKMKQPETININSLSNDDKDNEDINYFGNSIQQKNKYKEFINNIINNKRININNIKNIFNRKPNLINIKKNKVKFNINLKPNNKDILAVSSWFKREENIINRSFKNYKKILKTEENASISKKDISSNIIRLPRLKLLNYKSHKDINKINELKDTNKNNIDYNYLLSFSDKNSDKSEKKYNTPKKIGIKNNSSFPILTELNHHDHSYQFENYGNTIDIVMNSAKKELDKEKELDIKRRKLENVMGIENTPKVNYYDDILKRKSETIKNERNRRALRIIEKQKYLKGSKKEELNLKIANNVKLLDKVFRNIDIYNKNKHSQYK